MDTYPTITLHQRLRWTDKILSHRARQWCQDKRRQLGAVSYRSTWWSLLFAWPACIDRWLDAFRLGDHRFAPLMQYRFKDEIVRVWSTLDRLMIHLLFLLIKPTFAHLISPYCVHLQGPSAVAVATKRLKAALATTAFPYVIRLDIKKYYASIQHDLLVSQLHAHFDDPRVRHYLEAIVTSAIDDGGVVFLPRQGIPRRSSLSPFFGALYLSALDEAFSNRTGMFYLRYMDDIVILIESRRAYQKAKKRLFSILKTLKLQIAPTKTRMGRLSRAFHFLGVQFAVPRSPQTKIQARTSSVTVHPRTCRRALDRVKVLQEEAGHPADVQRYLMRWATWWQAVTGLSTVELMAQWVQYTEGIAPSQVWLGRGLLMPTLRSTLLPIPQ